MRGNMGSETTPSKTASQTEHSDLLSSLLFEFKRNKLILYFIAITTPLTLLTSLLVPHELVYDVYTYLEVLAIISYVSFVLWATYFYFHMLFTREQKPTIKFLNKLKTLLCPISKPISFIILMVSLNVAFSNYTFLKSLIPYFNRYAFDLDFYYLDKWLHFGFSPWEVTHYLFPGAFSSLVMSALYNLWFFLMWGMLLFFVIDRKNELLRNQFLLTFLSSWLVIGNVMATLLSSAGPAFFHHFESLDAYAQLMQRLESQSEYLSEQGLLPLWMLSTQDMLWENYIDGVIIKGSGISAMPSLHVTIAVLMAMTAFKLNKKLGYVAWVYTFIIQIGSVHLAWHYAVDGYVGALCVVILWHLIGYLLRRNHQSITQPQ